VNWISPACFFIFTVLVASALFRNADLFSPARIFTAIWSLAIGLANLKYSFFQREWSAFGWLNILIGVSSMLLGFLIAYVMFLDRPAHPIRAIRARLSANFLDERRLFYSITILTVLYAVGLAVETAAADGLPLMSGNPDRSRIDFGLWGVHLFVTTMPTILLLATEYVLVFRKSASAWRTSVVWLCSVVVFISFAFLLQRFGYIMWVVPTIVFVYYATGRIRLRHLIFSGALLLGFLQLLQTVRVARYVENYSYVISRLSFPRTYAMFAEPYMYIVMNLENFARSVDQWSSYSFGYFTFDFLMAITGLKHPLAGEFGFVERPFLISGFNTFSFLMPFYQDFGVFGVAGIPLLLGVVIGYSYHRMRSHPTITGLVAYGLCVYLLLISFFIHALGMLTVFSNVVLLLSLNAFFLEKRVKA